jgi:hypothetical protein
MWSPNRPFEASLTPEVFVARMKFLERNRNEIIEAKDSCIDFGSGTFPALFNAAWIPLHRLLYTNGNGFD